MSGLDERSLVSVITSGPGAALTFDLGNMPVAGIRGERRREASLHSFEVTSGEGGITIRGDMKGPRKADARHKSGNVRVCSAAARA